MASENDLTEPGCIAEVVNRNNEPSKQAIESATILSNDQLGRSSSPTRPRSSMSDAKLMNVSPETRVKLEEQKQDCIDLIMTLYSNCKTAVALSETVNRRVQAVRKLVKRIAMDGTSRDWAFLMDVGSIVLKLVEKTEQMKAALKDLEHVVAPIGMLEKSEEEMEVWREEQEKMCCVQWAANLVLMGGVMTV